MKSIPAKRLVREYAALQGRLCDALFEQYPIDDINLLTDLPKQGPLPLSEELWEFHRHGTGVCFTNVSTGTNVDAHLGPIAFPCGIDAWRLCRYLQSRRIETVTHGSAEFAASNEKSLERILDQLTDEGLLKVVDLEHRIHLLTQIACG